MKHTITLLLMALLHTLTITGQKQLAFPGAEGWGRYATGGRYGTVYHVTNLNDSGSGSLRDAVSQPNRIVVFDVCGVINIKSRMSFSANLYVAGQTAPGEGVIVYGDGVTFSSADNIIVRYMKFRMGKNGSSGKDAAGIANGTNMIFDHCSIAWGLDETFSINWDNKRTAPSDITIQNCLIGQGLLSHSAGGLIQADNITLYRNFYCDNDTRNNKIKGRNQYVNCLVYNWHSGCYLMGGDSQGTSYVNTTNNLFINGPGGGGNAITSGNSDFHIYASDNWQDRNADGKFNPYEIPHNEYSGGPTFESKPYPYPELPAWNALELIDSLLPEVGASLPYRDLADHLMVHQVKSFGKEGAIISSEYQLPIGAPTAWGVKSWAKAKDSDGDGMPDDWENANGTNPNANDAMTIATNGYANIENYINSLTTENRTLFLRRPILADKKATTDTSITLGWYDFTEGEEGFVVEVQKNGAYTPVATTEANAEEVTLTDLEPGTSYTFRIKAVKGDSSSDYSDLVTCKTQPAHVEMVDCDNYTADYTWTTQDGSWNTTDQNWDNGLYADGGKVLFSPSDDCKVDVPSDVKPSAVVVNTASTVTIAGKGKISGNTSVNKTGEGTLVLSSDNNYTGATVLHEGTISFSTLRNGDAASSIGASAEFGQNWIWDGGRWNYTGGTTSTNRDANLYNDTEFDVANSNSTVTMNGSIIGEGNVTFGGKGTVSPSSPSFFKYSGETIVEGGTLHLGYLSSLEDKKVYLGTSESSSSKLVLAGGTFSTKDANDNYCTYYMPIEAREGTTSIFQPYRNCYIKSKLTGSGTIDFRISWVREYWQNDMSEFYGTLIANGVGSSNQLILQNDGIPNGVVQLKGKDVHVIYWNTNGDLRLGGLRGDAGTYLSGSSKSTDGFKMTWRVGGANTNETFKGVIDNCASNTGHTGTVTIVKEGSGYWRLTGANIYKGTTTVEGGKLIVNGSHTGGGNYYVKDGATLAGTGTINSPVTIQNGGTILAGDSLIMFSSVLKLTSNLTVSNGVVEFPFFATDNTIRNSRISVSGKLTLNNATLRLNIDQAQEIPDGTDFKLFSNIGSTAGNGFTAIEPERPSPTQKWDISTLLTDGKLRVVKDETVDAINTITEEDDDNAPIYDLQGRRVHQPTKGIFIRNGKKIIK